ncbi:hypothetical protein TNCV_4807721 [Trichonephila clavipes]|nr:hypothetical protein TNCV_4807721 [Trichonephila clavipes]
MYAAQQNKRLSTPDLVDSKNENMDTKPLPKTVGTQATIENPKRKSTDSKIHRIETRNVFRHSPSTPQVFSGISTRTCDLRTPPTSSWPSPLNCRGQYERTGISPFVFVDDSAQYIAALVDDCLEEGICRMVGTWMSTDLSPRYHLSNVL